MSFNKANMDVRVFMADRGITMRDMEDFLGCYHSSISKKLSKELPEAEKEKLLDSIEACAKSRSAKQAPAEEPHEEVNDGVTNGPRFQVGDRVKIPSKQLCIGIVGDIWHSLSNNALMYAVDTEDGRRSLYSENQLEPAPIPTVYHFTAEISGNVAVVTMNATQGEKEWVYARGHAHILHDGEVGMAQAVSYAARRMFESLDKQQENKIYFKKEEMK